MNDAIKHLKSAVEEKQTQIVDLECSLRHVQDQSVSRVEYLDSGERAITAADVERLKMRYEKQINSLQMAISIKEHQIKEFDRQLEEFKVKLEEESHAEIASQRTIYLAEIEAKQKEIDELQRQTKGATIVGGGSISGGDTSRGRMEAENEMLRRQIKDSQNMIADIKTSLLELDMKATTRENEIVAYKQKIKVMEVEVAKLKVNCMCWLVLDHAM
jgi:chromosome segregation ATPase